MVRKMKAILHGSARKLDMGSVSLEMMGCKQVCMCLHEFMYAACEIGPSKPVLQVAVSCQVHAGSPLQ